MALRRWNGAEVIGLSAFGLLLLAVGWFYLSNGLELQRGHVSATATVLKVEEKTTRFRYGNPERTLVTVRFVDRSGQTVEALTDAVVGTPQVGDRVDIYYATDDPRNVAEIGHGPPGRAQIGFGRAVCVLAGFCALIVFLGRFKPLWRVVLRRKPPRHAKPTA